MQDPRGFVDSTIVALFGLAVGVALTTAQAAGSDPLDPTSGLQPGLWQMTLEEQKQVSLLCISNDPQERAAEAQVLALILPPPEASAFCTQTVSHPKRNEAVYRAIVKISGPLESPVLNVAAVGQTAKDVLGD